MDTQESITSRLDFETLPRAKQEEIKDRRRDRQAAYRESHREELRDKQRRRRYDPFAAPDFRQGMYKEVKSSLQREESVTAIECGGSSVQIILWSLETPPQQTG
ncbi:hypothetical protein BDN70DRAFT_900248 [Pholiota conissans]|uniref:Uncharacterized protein n=1 Tax=Pholiota conissans TaxID=109636 RepID=A0A9P5YN41_9AGAR|nr:hypothetical protein BDN70DRAFT_900248 [Pholiota conissans]